MKRRLIVAAQVVAITALLPGASHALETVVQADTVEVERVVEVADLAPTGSTLARTLEEIAEEGAVDLEVEIEVSTPISLPAGTYASRYRISPDLAQQIIDVAVAEGIDPDLAFRLVRVESVFRSRARGPQGALGLTQLMPSTARFIDRRIRTEDQILDPQTNLRLGFRYLRRLILQFDGDLRLGLLAYNRGEGTVGRALRAGRDPENGYSHRVLGTRGSNPYRGSGLLASREG